LRFIFFSCDRKRASRWLLKDRASTNVTRQKDQ